MDLFTYLMAKKGTNTYRDLFSYLLGKGAGGGGTYTTFTGTSLSISNTIRAKIKNFMLNSAELTQDETPSPSNPVDVNVITGNNNVMVESKNLFDYHWFGSDKEVQWEYYTGSNFRAIPIYIGVGNSATFSSNVPQTSPSLLYGLNSLNIATTSNDPININHSSTKQADVNGYVYLTFVNTRQYYTEVANGTYYIQIEIGSTATEYVEHQEQNYPISLSSKNLAFTGWASDFVTRINSSSSASLETFDNRSCLKYSASAGYGSYDTKYLFKINWKENTQYTFSFAGYKTGSTASIFSIEYTDGTTQEVSNTTVDTWENHTFTSASNKTIKYARSKYMSGNMYIDINTFQVEEGTTATTYEPYYNIEYCKIGDYADQIFKNTTDSPYYDNTLVDGDWYIKQEIKKVILNETGTWSMSTGGNAYNFWRFNYAIPNVHNGAYTKYCDYFEYTSTTFSTAPVPSLCENSSAPMFIFRTDGSQGTTVDEWKAWIAEHNLTVYCRIETPTYIHITETDYPTLKGQLDNLYNNAESYVGTTNITQTNDDLPFNLELSILIKGE